MPNYEYECEVCGVFTVRQGFQDEPLTTCTACGRPAHKVFSVGAIIYRGKAEMEYEDKVAEADRRNPVKRGQWAV